VNEEDVFSFIEDKNADMFWQSTDRHTRAAKNKTDFKHFFGVFSNLLLRVLLILL
jgi:hypothetical protein